MALVAVIGLASCGSDDATSSSSDGSNPDTVTATTILVTPTAFATVAPTSTTTLTTTTTIVLLPGTQIPTESTYTIVSGDYPSTVAAKFEVDLTALLDLNGWELKGNNVPDWPLPGVVIKIPAGAVVPNEDGSAGTPTTVGETDDTAGTEGTGTGANTTQAPVTTVDTCAASEYEIQAGDVPSAVATKFDTTVDALAAANVNTPHYDAFIAGFTIIIPAKTDC